MRKTPDDPLAETRAAQESRGQRPLLAGDVQGVGPGGQNAPTADPTGAADRIAAALLAGGQSATSRSRPSAQVVVVAAEAGSAASPALSIRRAGYAVTTAMSGDDPAATIRTAAPAVVLLPVRRIDGNALRLIRTCRAADDRAALVVTAEAPSPDGRAEALLAGAHSCLEGDGGQERMLTTVARALKDFNDRGRTETGLIGSSPVMQAVDDRIRSVSRSQATVFVTGESGTGKELCARAIHAMSPRADGPFVAVNCGSLTEEAAEKQVFGDGAMFGTSGPRGQGPDGGTLFLDEICEMPLPLQVRLLRFLQDAAMPAGPGARGDARIVCATSRDPLTEITAGRFRGDLYYRLHVVPIHMPPLRARGDDVIEIAEHVLRGLAIQEGRGFRELGDEVKARFRAYDWPGNVRELHNVLRHVVVLHHGERVSSRMLPPEVGAAPLCAIPSTGSAAPNSLIGRSLAEIERIVIEETIRLSGNSIPKAARVLKVSPSTIYRKRESWLND